MGDPVGRDPELLHARPLEQDVDGVRRRAAQHAGERSSERVELRRQPLLERGGDVDVVVELVDDVDGERVLDLRVLNQILACALPGAGVEHLPLDPESQDRDEHEHGGQYDEHPDDRSAASCSGAATPAQPTR